MMTNLRTQGTVLCVRGGVQSRNHSQSNIDRGFVYLEGSKIIGPLIWVFIE